MPDSQEPVMLFDGDCAFCTKCAVRAHRLRLNCVFTALQSVDLPSLGVDPVRARREVALRFDDGTVLYGHETIAGVLRTGSFPWRFLGRVLVLGPINRLSATVYRAVSQHRYQLPGGARTCVTKT
ncbi:MAG TPA: DCC1-like thiol-disulfide oxidoreductase family protein [Acidimicrobiales bacterium]